MECTAKDTISVICLHENLHLMEQTASLLNSEWPRSMTARLRSLESSRIQGEVGFPVSLILVTRINGTEEVIGHSKVMLIHNQGRACYVESVVINIMMRGKGYGRLIMERTEDYVKRKEIKCIYLTTQTEEEFYSKLGYQKCTPIMFCGSGSTTIQEKCQLFGMGPRIYDPGEDFIGSQAEYPKPNSEFQRNTNRTSSAATSEATILPPPPPPPSTLASPPSSVHKIYMKKEL